MVSRAAELAAELAMAYCELIPGLHGPGRYNSYKCIALLWPTGFELRSERACGEVLAQLLVGPGWYLYIDRDRGTC